VTRAAVLVDPRVRIAVGVATALPVGCVPAIVLVARTDPVAAARLGLLLSGVLTVLSGVGVIGWSIRGHRAGSRQERPRLLMGVGLMVWGCGQMLIPLQITDTGRRSFGIGDLISGLAVPVVLLAFLSVPHRSRFSRPGRRLALDALVVTSAATLAYWWLVLAPVLPDRHRPGEDGLSAVVVSACDLGVAAAAVLSWVRDRRRPGAAGVAVALSLQAVADLSSLSAVVGDGPFPWISGALWALAMPVLAVAVISYRVRTDPARYGEVLLEDLGESRVSMVSAVTTIVLLAVLMVLPVRDRWDPIGGSLAGIGVALLLTRELANAVIRNRLVASLSRDALRDPLTGLLNRGALTARLRSLDRDTPWALLTLDLDGFRELNEQWGHEAGDAQIVAVGQVLTRVCPPPCVVARLGGDEFGVLTPGTAEEGGRLAERIIAALGGTSPVRPGAPRPAASVGVGRASTPRDPESVAPSTGGSVPCPTAADDADPDDGLAAFLESATALEAARATGRNQVALFPGEVEQARHRRWELERRLAAAIDAEALRMHAQPLVDLRTGRIAGYESLARWTDPTLGPVSPAEFVPIAERTGLITALGSFALRTTLREAADCGVVGRDVEIGVNVSPIQLRQEGFARRVLELLDELGVPRGQLVLEVTEAILVDEDDPASGTLAALAVGGVRLGIDDFGTGYSALTYLRRLPFHILKVDRSWVVAGVGDPRTRDVIGGVVDLSHTLGARVVMEGIEDEATAAFCRDLDADLGQGWFFGRPRPWPLVAEDLTTAAAPVAEREPGR
jgi:diguanylate cyclase (GGDEF)-like protein